MKAIEKTPEEIKKTVPPELCGRCNKPKKGSEKDRCHCGRPIEYSYDIVQNTREYLEECQDDEDEFHKTRGDKSDGYERIIRAKLPTIEGLAVYLKHSKETLYQWEKQYDEFSDVMNELRSQQAERLINRGISGDYNPMITKVLLTKHGYRDSVENLNTNVPVDEEAKKRGDKAVEEYLNEKKKK